jgi:hypothetical protein
MVAEIPNRNSGECREVMMARVKVLATPVKETDALRLEDLSRLHNLPFRKVRSRYIFEDYTARGLREALGFVERYDRAMAASSGEKPGKRGEGK